MVVVEVLFLPNIGQGLLIVAELCGTGNSDNTFGQKASL